MSRVVVEWSESEFTWRRVDVKFSYSKNRNCFFKLNQKVYVFRDMRENAEVLTKENGKWVKAGRVSRGDIFLGEGISYGEWSQTLEGKESIKNLLLTIRKGFT